jgi:hypothetical protein
VLGKNGIGVVMVRLWLILAKQIRLRRIAGSTHKTLPAFVFFRLQRKNPSHPVLGKGL